MNNEYIYTKGISDIESALATAINQTESVFILCDSNTLRDCWPKIAGFECLKDANIIELDPGESNKSLEISSQIWMTLLENNADRSSILVNLGGGVITDLGGFVASTFKRGIKFINIPTSLIGIIDASLGSKTGINFGISKNQIGTFAEPELLIIAPSFIDSLEDSEIISGFAEMIKHGLIADPDHWISLSQLDEISAQSIKPFIEHSLRIKQDIVRQDPMEKNIRKSLNFGHTVGHAFESISFSEGDNLSHGHAIAIGMYIETCLSEKLVGLGEEESQEIKSFIGDIYELELVATYDSIDLWRVMQKDKKNEGTSVRMSLLKAIGQTKINVPVSFEDFQNIMNGLFL